MRNLSRNEMKRINGGKGQTICTCGNTMITTACSYNDLSGAIQCHVLAVQYCSGLGYDSVSCTSGSGPS